MLPPYRQPLGQSNVFLCNFEDLFVFQKRKKSDTEGIKKSTKRNGVQKLTSIMKLVHKSIEKGLSGAITLIPVSSFLAYVCWYQFQNVNFLILVSGGN